MIFKFLNQNINETEFQTSLSNEEIMSKMTNAFQLKEKYDWFDGLNTKQQGTFKNQTFRIEGIVSPFADLGKNKFSQLLNNYIVTSGVVKELTSVREITVDIKFSFIGLTSLIAIVFVSSIFIIEAIVLGNIFTSILYILIFCTVLIFIKQQLFYKSNQLITRIEELLNKIN